VQGICEMRTNLGKKKRRIKLFQGGAPFRIGEIGSESQVMTEKTLKLKPSRKRSVLTYTRPKCPKRKGCCI